MELFLERWPRGIEKTVYLLADLESRLSNYAQDNPYPQNFSIFFYSRLNKDSEIAFDQLKSNLIEKLLNPQFSWNINIKYLKVLPSHVGTTSNPIKLMEGKKGQHCTRNQKTRTLALTLPKEKKMIISPWFIFCLLRNQENFNLNSCIPLLKSLSCTSTNKWCQMDVV